MDKRKLIDTDLYMGIDTIEVRSDTEIMPEGDADFIPTSARKHNATDRYYYKLNPDKGLGAPIYNSRDYYDTRCYMVKYLNMTNPMITRIDYRFDSYDDNFTGLLKLNKLLILLIAEAYAIGNRYYSIDPLTLEELCVRVQNDRIEAENYNKGLEEPDGAVKNRLELRSKKLYDESIDDGKEYSEYLKWCKRLDKAVTKQNFEKLQAKLNDSLYERYKEQSSQRGFVVNEFLYKYQSSIFTSHQMSDFYKMLGYKDPEQQAKRYKQRKSIEYFSYRNVYDYVQMLKKSGADYFRGASER